MGTANLSSQRGQGREERASVFVQTQTQGLLTALNVLEKLQDNQYASQSETFISFRNKLACLPNKEQRRKVSIATVVWKKALWYHRKKKSQLSPYFSSSLSTPPAH